MFQLHNIKQKLPLYIHFQYKTFDDSQVLFILLVPIDILMIPQDQIRLILTLVIIIPLSYFIRFIRPTQYRYIYSLILSFLLQIFLFKHHILGVYIQNIIVFFLIKTFKSKKIGVIITVQSMLFLSFYQIKQILYNYGGWSMGPQGLLMVLVCKYSLLAYAIQDGLTNQDKLTAQQKTYRLTSDVTFYDYIGFINFLPTSVMGPPLQYIQYKRFMELEKPYDSVPQTLSQTLKTLGHAFTCAAIFLAGEFLAPISYMKTDQFYQKNVLYVLFYTFLSMTFIRFKYYFGWKLISASVDASGVSYNGQKFNLVKTCSPLIIQTDKHIRTKISHWNTAVQQWLRKCVYQRSPFKSKGISQLYVFMISAFWHGFYAGYYFSFFLWFVQVYTQGEIFRFVKSQNSRLKTFYRGLGFLGSILVTILVNFIFSHNATFFILLDHNLCFKLLQKVNYIPQTILITLAVTFTLLNSMRAEKTKKVQLKPPTMMQQKNPNQKPFKKQ